MCELVKREERREGAGVGVVVRGGGRNRKTISFFQRSKWSERGKRKEKKKMGVGQSDT